MTAEFASQLRIFGGQSRFAASNASGLEESGSNETESGESAAWLDARCAYKGAEFLVAADLSLAGLSCSVAAEGLRYDLVVDDGSRIFTVQVKSTGSPELLEGRSARYSFTVLAARRVADCVSREGTRAAYSSLVDVFAFVALDCRQILYRVFSEAPPRNVRILPSTFTDERRDLSRKEAFR